MRSILAAERFDGSCGAEDRFFSEMRSENLEADRFSVDRFQGDGDAAVSGEVGGDGEDVSEVVLEGITSCGSDFRSGFGSHGREDGVDFFEGFFEVAADESADLQRAAVVGIVVSGGEDIGAKDDPAFDLGSESFFTAFLINAEDVIGLGTPIAVADAIEAGEVRGRFGGSDDVVGRYGIFGMRERNFDDLGALGLEIGSGFFNTGANAGIDSIGEVFFRQAELHSGDSIFETFGVIGNIVVE